MSDDGGPRPEMLRLLIMEALGEHADPRAHDLVRTAEIVVEQAAIWQSSSGPVQAHRVGLGLEASELGDTTASPHRVDELVSAAARAIVGLEPRPGRWTLSDLTLYWRGSARPESAGYRDRPPASLSLQEAMAAFLRARGESEAANVLGQAGCVVVQRAASDVAVKGAPTTLRPALERCLRALLSGFERVPIHIEWTN